MAHMNGDRRNQLLFREVNQRIREVSDGWGPDGAVEFLCECGHEECVATFALTEAQFDGLLGNEDRFVLASEHRSEANGHRILAEYDDFLVVAAEPEVLAT
jgi:hypothetical protein